MFPCVFILSIHFTSLMLNIQYNLSTQVIIYSSKDSKMPHDIISQKVEKITKSKIERK